MYPKPLNYRIAAYGILFLLCLSSLSLLAQRKEITYKDNKLVLFVHPKDTSVVIDPLTGEEKFVVTSKSDDVLSLDAERVHRMENEQVIELLKQAVEERISGIPTQLEKGTYNYYVETVVINKQGEVAYQQPGNVFPVQVTDLDRKDATPMLTDAMRQLLNDEITRAVESAKVPPVQKDGKPVNIVVHLNGSFVVE